MKKHFLFATIFLALTTGRSLACECMEMDETTRLGKAGLAFSGIAAPLGSAPNGDALTAFTIKTLYKGRAETSAVIHHREAGPACGMVFNSGETYTILAYRGSDGKWHTNSCMNVWDKTALDAYKDKIDALTAPIMANPQDEAALLAKGNFLLENRDNEGALALFNYLLGINPGNADGLVGRAKAFMALGSMKEAKADLENALMHDQENAQAILLKDQIPQE